MAQGLTTANREVRARRQTRTVLYGLFRLSKVMVYQHYYGWALAWLLLSSQALRRPGTTAAMLMFLLGSIAIVSCACTVDDIVGFRNGSDAENYQAGERARKIQSKPLLSGAITEREAVAFWFGSAAVAVLAGLAAFWLLRWHAPVAAYIFYAVGAILSVQYSAGLRFSYHRLGAETLLCLATASGLLAPYLAAGGRWSAPAVIEALLVGLWLVMVSSYSNVNDIAGDRGVGRKTLAVTASPKTFKAAMVLLVFVSAGLTCALAFATSWPWWTLLTMLPAISFHAWQLYLGPVREQWLRARRIGLHAYDLGFLGIGIPTLYMLLTQRPV
jgi:1,4-dihydroxy-2-naphthoate octaprenyltransferase